MTLARPVTCAVALVTLIAGGGASSGAATPKASCLLVTDASGDANDFTVRGTPVSPPPGTGLPVPPSDDYLDILSGDIASDGKVVTAAIRLKALGIDVTSPEVSTLTFTFRVGRRDLELHASNTTLVQEWSFRYRDSAGTNGEASGVVDSTKNEIRISAPASAWPRKIKRGDRISGLRVRAERYVVIFPRGAWITADSASSQRTYVVGSRSCLTPGR